MYEYSLLIPKERVAVLIGTKGATKRLIEKVSNTKLTIENEKITIASESSYDGWMCQQVVKAIGRGFNPKDAIKIIRENASFELINVMDYARNKNDKIRLLGRVIGEDGKTRKRIEKDTECKVVAFGKTIGIIGDENKIKIASEAVKMLLNGAQTTTVYRFLSKSIKARLKKELFS